MKRLAADKLANICKTERKTNKEALERLIAKDKERIGALEKMVVRLYEDMIAGRITDKNFNLIL